MKKKLLKMQLKTNNLNYSINLKFSLLITALFSLSVSNAQEIIKEEVLAKVEDNTTANQRKKIDGVAAVVGDFVVLESDIDKELLQLKARGVSASQMPSRCQLFGKLLEDKLYVHHAIQDSLTVDDSQIRAMIEQQFNAILQELGGDLNKMLKFYNKDSEQELRQEMFDINKNGQLAQKMQAKIIEKVEVTPEEVREYFNKIPKEERPIFGTELKVGQIVVIPQVTQEEKQKVIDRLKAFKADVIENGASFTTKAVFYSDDVASRKDGGKYSLDKKRPMMVKEFRDVAFSLQEGEISEPFETDFGYHIVLLEKIRGQIYDVRHILLRPEITEEAKKKAKEKIDLIRQRIVDGEIAFTDAARQMSDEKETRNDGGLLRNPETQDFSFELTKMDSELYSQIEGLKDGEVSVVYTDQDRVNPIKYKILTVLERIDDHEANFAKDYLKIKRLAEQDKQYKAIDKWTNEKIMDTYIKINGDNRDCEFNSNWLKK